VGVRWSTSNNVRDAIAEVKIGSNLKFKKM
jgi:hypothetical protein